MTNLRSLLKAMFNGEEEGKARMEGRGQDKEVASSRFNTSAQKSLPFGAAHIYIAHIREYPPGKKTRSNSTNGTSCTEPP